MAKKVYLDYTDCGRGCMPGVYDEPGEGRVEFEMKEDAIRPTPSNSIFGISSSLSAYAVNYQGIESAVIDSMVYGRGPVSNRIEATLLGLNAEQIEGLANFFRVKTGLEPIDILHHREDHSRNMYPVSMTNSLYPYFGEGLSITAITQHQLNNLAIFFKQQTGLNPDRVDEVVLNTPSRRGIASGAAMGLGSEYIPRNLSLDWNALPSESETEDIQQIASSGESEDDSDSEDVPF